VGVVGFFALGGSGPWMRERAWRFWLGVVTRRGISGYEKRSGHNQETAKNFNQINSLGTNVTLFPYFS
jgi:hypothetical protein